MKLTLRGEFVLSAIVLAAALIGLRAFAYGLVWLDGVLNTMNSHTAFAYGLGAGVVVALAALAVGVRSTFRR